MSLAAAEGLPESVRRNLMLAVREQATIWDHDRQQAAARRTEEIQLPFDPYAFVLAASGRTLVSRGISDLSLVNVDAKHPG